MISLKSLMKSVKEAKITSPQKGVETPLDAKIQISGFGVMTRNQLQKGIVRTLHEVSQYVKKGIEDWIKIWKQTNWKNGKII